jgi:hypothetical protein
MDAADDRDGSICSWTRTDTPAQAPRSGRDRRAVERNVGVIRQLRDGGDRPFQRMLPWPRLERLRRRGRHSLPDEFWHRPDR